MDFAFLHGGGQGSWVWEQTLAAMALKSALEPGRRCLALDAPGCGIKRGRDTSAITFDDVAYELIGDIETAGLRDVILVGHSQAGMVLPRMVEFRPDLFAHLVYVTCSAPAPGVTTIETMASGLHGESEDRIGWLLDPATTSMEQRFAAMFCNDMTAGATDAFLARLGSDMWPASSYSYRDWRHDHLGAIPATFVLCLKDQSLPPPWQERFAERLKVDEIVRIDAGHQVMNTRPHALSEVLLAMPGGRTNTA